jgi:hypothetical protein
LLQHELHQLALEVEQTQHNHSTSMCCTAGTQCTTKSSQHSEVSMEGVATVASHQPTSLKHTGPGSLLQHGMHQLPLEVENTQDNHSTSMCCTAGTQCTTKSSQQSEVSIKGVGIVASINY